MKIRVKKVRSLRLSEEGKPQRKRAPPLPAEFMEIIIEAYDDGWPGHEEPFIDVQKL